MRRHLKDPDARPARWSREDYLPTRDELAWLASPAGVSVCEEMASRTPADTPAAIAHWRERLSAGLVAAAWHQVTWRRAAAVKFSRASLMLMDRVSLEQATDELIARHKARRFTGYDRVADFCCGMGGDSLALGAVAPLTAVDRSAIRTFMARHNAQIYGAAIEVLEADARSARISAAAIHIDPDRRSGGPRTTRLESYSPDLATLQDLVRHYHHAAIKISPGADFNDLPFPAELELISHRGECKQAVLWTGGLAQAHRRATLLPSGESLSAATEAELAWPESSPPRVGQYIFEPDAAIIRANLVAPLARRFGLAPVDARIAYLSGPDLLLSPLMSCFHILEVFAWSRTAARRVLAEHDIGSLDIKTRGFAAAPEQLLGRLKARGANHATLLLTRIAERPTAVLARRMVADAQGGSISGKIAARQ